MLNFENLDKFIFPGVGRYGIPQIEPTQQYPVGEFIPVNYHYHLRKISLPNVSGREILHFSQNKTSPPCLFGRAGFGSVAIQNVATFCSAGSAG